MVDIAELGYSINTREVEGATAALDKHAAAAKKVSDTSREVGSSSDTMAKGVRQTATELHAAERAAVAFTTQISAAKTAAVGFAQGFVGGLAAGAVVSMLDQMTQKATQFATEILSNTPRINRALEGHASLI